MKQNQQKRRGRKRAKQKKERHTDREGEKDKYDEKDKGSIEINQNREKGCKGQVQRQGDRVAELYRSGFTCIIIIFVTHARIETEKEDKKDKTETYMRNKK